MGRKRKNPPTAEDTAVLQFDLVESILAKLPVKSLLKFKTVCKFWNAMISSPHFIKIQSDQASSSSPGLFLVNESLASSSISRSLCLLKFEDQNFQRETDKLPNFSYSPEIVCSCNGIVLLRKDRMSSVYILLNPCSRMYIMIWSHYHSTTPVSYGLLHDPITDDYKVVIVTISRKYSVYSVKEKAWTKRDVEFPSFGFISPFGVCVDGVLHWIQYQYLNENMPEEIIFFDGVHDRCGKLQLPTRITEKSLIGGDLTCVKGCLGVCYRYVKNSSEMAIRLCIMGKNGGENSYKELMTVSVKDWANTCRSHRSPCPIKDDMIMVFVNCVKYFIYDVGEEKVVGEIQRFSEMWDSEVIRCWDQLFFPTSTRTRPWRKCRATTRALI